MDEDGWKSVKPFLEEKKVNYAVVIGMKTWQGYMRRRATSDMLIAVTVRSPPRTRVW